MKTDKKTQGKKNLEAGRRFEVKIRKDLESKGWIVSRWCNNVELHKENSLEVSGIHDGEKFIYGRLIPAKQGKFRKTSTGFPDFIVFSPADTKTRTSKGLSFVMGVECKSNGYLTREEKAKCWWLIKNNIFTKILIASKGKKRGEIKYREVK